MAQLRLRKDQRIELLRGVELFAGCNSTELGRIASLTTEHAAKAGEVLAEQDEPGEEFFVVIEGEAKASRRGVELATLRPGSFFGELALLDRGKRTATVVAETDMRLLVLSAREFASVHLLTPSVARKMIAELGARLRRADDMLDVAPTPGRGAGPWSL